LSYQDDSDGRGDLIVTVKNVGNKVLDGWLLEIRAPRPLVEGASVSNYGAFVPEESDRKTSVFRTHIGLAREKRIFRDGSQSLKVPFQMKDEIAGLLDQRVVGRAYIDANLEEETERPVRELTSFFAAANVAVRKAQSDMSKAIVGMGNELLKTELAKQQDELVRPLDAIKALLEGERERIADYGFSTFVEPFGQLTLGGRHGVQLIATSRDGTECHTFSIEIGFDGLKSVSIRINGDFDPRVALMAFPMPTGITLVEFLKSKRVLDFFRDVILGKGLPSAIPKKTPRAMTFDDFKFHVDQTFRQQYGARLSQRIMFEEDVHRTPRRWQAQFTVDGKQHFFMFDYGVPPVEDEEARFVRKLSDFCEGLT
jgi:hypothetical protein